MTQNEFDIQFQCLTKELVEIGHELLGFDKNEVDCVYVFGSTEDNRIAFKVFYKINGKVVAAHQVNTVSESEFDVSDDRHFAILKLGNATLRKLYNIFLQYDRQPPTLIKITFKPRSGSFECKLIYELQYSFDDDLSYVDVYKKWVKEESEK